MGHLLLALVMFVAVHVRSPKRAWPCCFTEAGQAESCW